MRRRLFALILFIASLPPAAASADWLITPLLGAKFGGDTNILDLEEAGGSRKFMFGASFGFLTADILGVEVDFSYIPSYFERDLAEKTVAGSSVLTLTGDVILAVPTAISRDGLRPYLIAGAGLVRPSAEFLRDAFPASRGNLFGLTLGGGAIGRLTNRTAVRFELRQFRTLTTDEGVLTVDRELDLTFWRATVGVAIRY